MSSRQNALTHRDAAKAGHVQMQVWGVEERGPSEKGSGRRQLSPGNPCSGPRKPASPLCPHLLHEVVFLVFWYPVDWLLKEAAVGDMPPAPTWSPSGRASTLQGPRPSLELSGHLDLLSLNQAAGCKKGLAG